MLTYKCWNYAELELRVRYGSHVNEASFMELTVYKFHGTNTKRSRQCLWKGWNSETGEIIQTTEIWWMLEKSEIGKASEINKKTWKTGEKVWTCEHFEMGEKGGFEAIAQINDIKDFGHILGWFLWDNLQSCSP